MSYKPELMIHVTGGLVQYQQISYEQRSALPNALECHIGVVSYMGSKDSLAVREIKTSYKNHGKVNDSSN